MNGNNYATNVVGIDGYISRKQNGTTGYLFKDVHGDVLTTYSSITNKLADYTYDAWGEQISVGNYTWDNANPIRYNGQYYDSESGMTYLRARYYDSDIRRFITEDPIKDGLNWYSYCSGNPVMFVDSNGLIVRFRTDIDKELGMALIQGTTGSDGYYTEEMNGVHVLKSSDTYTTSDGSALVRALLDAIINSNDVFDIAFDFSIKNNRTVEVDELDENHQTIYIGCYDNEINEISSFPHELIHAFSASAGFNEQIQMNPTGVSSHLYDEASKWIIKKYQEAIAITGDNYFRQEMGYPCRDDIGYSKTGVEQYGVFPKDLTNNPNANNLLGRGIKPGEIIKADVPYMYGEGIVEYILQHYRH